MSIANSAGGRGRAGVAIQAKAASASRWMQPDAIDPKRPGVRLAAGPAIASLGIVGIAIKDVARARTPPAFSKIDDGLTV